MPINIQGRMTDVATVDGARLRVVVGRLLATLADVGLHATADVVARLAPYKTPLLIPVAGLPIRTARGAVRAGRARRSVGTETQIGSERVTVCRVACQRADDGAMA